MVRMDVDADFKWGDVVIGADLDAVQFAHDNKFHLVKNRTPYHHSYEEVEEEWALKLYNLYELCLVPFSDKVQSVRVVDEQNIIKVYTEHNVFIVEYERLHVFDDAGVTGYNLSRELDYYRVIDWFDCQGLRDLDFQNIKTNEKFVHTVSFFKTNRIDGDQRYLDLLCESYLAEDDLKNFNFGNTMARLKIESMLKERGVVNPRLHFWKRDTYPIYKTI